MALRAEHSGCLLHAIGCVLLHSYGHALYLGAKSVP